MLRILRSSLFLLAVLLLAPPTRAQTPVRVASYNIRLLGEGVTAQQNRLDKLHDVIALLDADVIGLQEIADRTALELVFPPSEWTLLIDDDSAPANPNVPDIDLAVAVRQPFQLVGPPASLNAEARHFLFDGADETFFPGRRDVLFAEIAAPGAEQTFFVLVHHAKSRRGGRPQTDFRREGAARMLVDSLRTRFADTPFILVGDFNDNPDDRSLNILETGDSNAPAGPEEVVGPFLINLMEPLVTADHVSFGRKSNNVLANGRLETIDPGSRARNNDARVDDGATGDILFDQMLIPGWMADWYVSGSARIFDHAVGAIGNSTNRASDHLPVFAEFIIPADEPEPPAAAGARVFSLLPNPDGSDAGREELTIINATDADLDLAGWTLRDASSNTLALRGVVPVGARLTLVLAANALPLNNTGDTVDLLDPNGTLIHTVTYTGAQAVSGETVVFP